MIAIPASLAFNRPRVCSLGLEWRLVEGCPGQFHGTFGEQNYHAVYDDPIKARWICLWSNGGPFRQLEGEDLATVVESLKAWLGDAAPRGTR